MPAKPSKLKFQIQAPITVKELTLSAYNFLICYKFSDLVTNRRWWEQTSPRGNYIGPATEKSLYWCASYRNGENPA